MVFGIVLMPWVGFRLYFGILGKVLVVILLSWRAFGVTSGGLGAPARPKFTKKTDEKFPQIPKTVNFAKGGPFWKPF